MQSSVGHGHGLGRHPGLAQPVQAALDRDLRPEHRSADPPVHHSGEQHQGGLFLRQRGELEEKPSNSPIS